MVDFVDSDDVVRRAKLIYAERLRSDMERDHRHEFVAIEPDSGEYFLGKTFSEAGHYAQDVYPDRMTFVVRVGHKAAIHMGLMVIN